MLAFAQPIRTIRPYHAFGIFLFFFLGFYLGLLFVVGAMAALVVAVPLFRGKSRLLMAMGGGFSGLAAWITVLLNHKEQYERVIAFLAQHLSKNWAVFMTDSFICILGAMIFIGVMAGTRGTAKRMVAAISGRGKGSTEDESVEPESV
jgi:hypothetical protein